MMHIYPAGSRGGADYDWLKTKYSYSFSDYYNPARMGFGALRVLNDDYIAGGMGFDPHPHRDMEIITVPFSGALAHQDSMGHSETVHAGEVQVMSAGTGVVHSEYNASEAEPVTLFQIWIIPKVRGVTPRYDQTEIPLEVSKWSILVGPHGLHDGLWIHQDAWIYRGQFEQGTYDFPKWLGETHGWFVMVIDGEVELNGNMLKKRDATEITGENALQIVAGERVDVLLMQIPL